MPKKPIIVDLIELLEDRKDLEIAKQVKGKDISLDDYLAKRGLQNSR